ncbi:unnamed protein product [Clonostachys rosea f. rosea IK726]|uniref:Uncharacterized protein n=1 Tax=Clonostachys rosea f. rosea IK726 TaxID=1349383 RepID=A0ACA9UFH6_BIOOC|nr:unnamed protein product [Clonostachys rosea f. rosea IK726]
MSQAAPTFLIIGATGNTGLNLVRTLSRLIQSSGAYSSHRILALTRSAQSPAAQEIAQLPNVRVLQKFWPAISAEWLRENRVHRAFVASAVAPGQFADESGFLLAALQAGVDYVVRISTTAANVRPDLEAYYPRQHWAIEALLSSPEFKGLKWSSLQPNVFSSFVLGPAVALVKKYRETGEQEPLRLMPDENAPCAVIDAADVGELAAHLLVEEDISGHNQSKYVLNGPDNVTGRDIVALAEKAMGTSVTEVHFKDMGWLDGAAAANPEQAHLLLSIKHAPRTGWEGKTTVETSSKEVLSFVAHKRTLAESFKELLE